MLAVPGLYVHIPFCEKKCAYCDFYSIEKRDSTLPFLSALALEIRLRAADGEPAEPFDTVFLGGGTPSLLDPSQLGAILDQLAAAFPIAPAAEITVEANPGTLAAGKLEGYRAAGVNRMSIGIQSFLADELAFLDRIHSADDARDAVRRARAAGFENLSIDLIFALPMHTWERWSHSLDEAVALAPEHISAYTLIFEEGTPLYADLLGGRVRPIDVGLEADLYLRTVEQLAGAGYEQYEVSNFARGGRVSRHNLNYWRLGDYLGFGPSAHSHRSGHRWWNVTNLRDYLTRLDRGELPVARDETLDERQRMLEFVSLGLRSDGVRLQRFRQIFNFDLSARFRDTVREFERDGLLVSGPDRIRLTPRGYLLCDSLTLALVP